MKVALAKILPLPARNERGGGWGGGHLTAHLYVFSQAERPSSPQPSPPSEGGEGERSAALATYLALIQWQCTPALSHSMGEGEAQPALGWPMNSPSPVPMGRGPGCTAFELR